MVVVALVCVGAGTWQIARFDWKVRANDALTGNARAAAVAVGRVLPLVGRAGAVQRQGALPHGDRDRNLRRAGTRCWSGWPTSNSTQGFYVLTPLTHVRDDAAGRARLRPAAGRRLAAGVDRRCADGAGDDPRPRPDRREQERQPGRRPGRAGGVDQPGRAGAPGSATPVYNGYAQLLEGQPGQAGLTAIPAAEPVQPGRRRGRAAALRLHHPVVPVRAARTGRPARDVSGRAARTGGRPRPRRRDPRSRADRGRPPRGQAGRPVRTRRPVEGSHGRRGMGRALPRRGSGVGCAAEPLGRGDDHRHPAAAARSTWPAARAATRCGWPARAGR